MRFLFVLNQADDATGGTLRAALNTAQALTDVDDIDVTFAVPVRRDTSLNTVRAAAETIDVRLFPGSRPVTRFGGSVRHALWVWRNVSSFDVVCIHTVFYLGALYTALICRLRGVPYYVWPHNSLDPFDLQKHRRIKAVVGRLVFAPMLAGSRGIIAASDREARLACTFGARPARLVVPLPVTIEAGPPSMRQTWRANHDIGRDEFVVLFLGRVNYKKGLPILVDAVHRLAGRRVVLVVAGDGEERDVALLDEQIARLGLEHRVRRLGWVDGAQKTAALLGSDAFVLASDNESFGIAVIEAMLARLPVLISDQVYLCDELRAASAVGVVDRTAASIAAELEHLLDSRDETAAMAERGHAFAMENYAPGPVARSLLTAVAAERPQTAAAAP